MATLYGRLKSAGCELDNHESDLYVKLDATSREILRRWALEAAENRYSIFRSDIDGTMWAEVPFHFDPFYRRAAQ